jgi:hypothetical protein
MSIPLNERIERFKVGKIKVLDDFPILWRWFEEDDLLEEELHIPRLHTTSERYFYRKEYWHLLIHLLNIEYEKWVKDTENGFTVLLEFSRGAEHGGYEGAYQHISDMILKKAVSMYIQVSYQESLRKDRARFNPERPYSVMQHALEEEKMKRLYLEDDWAHFSSTNQDYLFVKNYKVPYAILENEDDVTTPMGSELGTRLEKVFQYLWKIWKRDRELS